MKEKLCDLAAAVKSAASVQNEKNHEAYNNYSQR